MNHHRNFRDLHVLLMSRSLSLFYANQKPHILLLYNVHTTYSFTMKQQGISAVENIMGRSHVINHEHIPAACFTHPEIAMVGLTEEQAKARATEQGFVLGKSVSHFKANSKALAELESDGIAKVSYAILVPKSGPFVL